MDYSANACFGAVVGRQIGNLGSVRTRLNPVYADRQQIIHIIAGLNIGSVSERV